MTGSRVPVAGELDYLGVSGRSWALLYALGGGQEVAVSDGLLTLREDPPLVTMAEADELLECLDDLESRGWAAVPADGSVAVTDSGRYFLSRWLKRGAVRRAMGALPAVSRYRGGEA